MTEELQQLLKNLKLRRILDIYDEQLRAAEKEQVSYSEFVTRLARAQWHSRLETALEWRILRAKLPDRWTLETFPYERQPGVNRKQIRAFAELEFVPKAENLVFIGETGRGKTGLACGILLKALENGYRCQFIRAQDLFDEMYASLADRSTRQLLKRLAHLDILLIDEFGYLNLKPEQSNIFFKLMEERYHRHSTIITTNLGYDEWHNFLGTGRWWMRYSAGYGTTVTQCRSKVRPCGNCRAENAGVGGFWRGEMGREPGDGATPLPSVGPAETSQSTPGPLSDSPRPAQRFIPGRLGQECISLLQLPGWRQRAGFRRSHGTVFDSRSGAAIAAVVFDWRTGPIMGAAKWPTGSEKRRVQSSVALRFDECGSCAPVPCRARNRPGYCVGVWGRILCEARSDEWAHCDSDSQWAG
jgi:DNA replication protein DnaC